MKAMKLIDILQSSAKSAICLVCAFVLSLASTASSENAGPSVALADTLYMRGEYSEAAEAYLALTKVDGESAGLLFNLANAYAQKGDLGNAILYYSRAHRLDPTDREIDNNLQYFISKVEDSNRAELRGKKISVAPDHSTFFQTVDRYICTGVGLDFWAVSGVVLFILVLGAVALYLFCSDVRLRKAGFFGGIVMFFCCIICVVLAFRSASYFDSHDRGVLMAYKLELLIEPSSDAKPACNLLCQGTVFDIIAEETDVEGNPTWYKVRLNSDIEGWIRASDISII